MGHLFSKPKQEEDNQDVLLSDIQKLKHDIQIQKNQNIKKWFQSKIRDNYFNECIQKEHRGVEINIWPLPTQTTKEELAEWIQSKHYQNLYTWMVLSPCGSQHYYYTIRITDTARQDYHKKTKLKLQKYWNSYFKKQIPYWLNFMKENGCTSCQYNIQEFMEKYSIPVLTNTIFDEFLQHPYFDMQYNQELKHLYITLN